jgi:hypothetical protein
MADDFKEIHLGSIQKRLVGTKCPHCGKPCDGGISLDDRRAARVPKPGDVAVCIYCGSINTYTETLSLRRIERTEQRRMLRDPRMAKLMELAVGASKNYRRKIQ